MPEPNNMELAYTDTIKTRTPHGRLTFLELPPSEERCFARAAGDGLSRAAKRLPCRYLYDEVGSQLFEQITRLPEYYLTRCENEILCDRALRIVGAMRSVFSVVELGSGSSSKTRHVLQAALKKQGSVHYTPIDISSQFLRQSSEALLREFAGLHIGAIAGEYKDALQALAPTPWPRLFMFLGSNLGNYETEDACELLSSVNAAMGRDDRLLVGIDLAKEATVIEPAYNDPGRVTERFNKNILLRINRELGGTFDLHQFFHSAPYLQDKGRVEMRLVSKRKQRVAISALQREIEFQEGETILTEVSAKYKPMSFDLLCNGAGLVRTEMWTDTKGYFAVALLAKQL